MANMLAARAWPDETGFRLEEVGVPEIAEGEVLVKVGASGLTPGMNILRATGMIKLLPATLGHEIAGTVDAVNGGVRGFSAGDRVRVHANLTCRSCAHCLGDAEMLCTACSMIGFGVFGPDAMPLYERYHHGGLAEYVRVPEWSLDPISADIPWHVAAKIHDVAGAHRALKCANLPIGSTLIVASGTGALGATTVRLAPHHGVAKLIVIGRAGKRLEEIAALDRGLVSTIALDELGEDWATNDSVAAAIRQIAPGGADALVDFTPAGPLVAMAARGLRNGGTIVLRAPNREPLAIPMVEMMHACWTVAATRNGTRADMLETIELIEDGRLRIDDLFTHQLPLTEVNEAMEAVEDRSATTWFVGIDVEGHV